MKPIYKKFIGALSLTIAIAACVPAPRPAPPVAPAPSPPISAPPPPAPPTVYDDWLDAPQTPGDWSYRGATDGGTASYRAPGGGELFAMSCERARGRITLTRFGATDNPQRQITIRSETAIRAIDAESVAGSLQAYLAVSDRLLDAMALSKGRFAVEAPGSATLYLPSWAEVTRVIEDCR